MKRFEYIAISIIAFLAILLDMTGDTIGGIFHILVAIFFMIFFGRIEGKEDNE